jgi:hypothetical protein
LLAQQLGETRIGIRAGNRRGEIIPFQGKAQSGQSVSALQCSDLSVLLQRYRVYRRFLL